MKSTILFLPVLFVVLTSSMNGRPSHESPRANGSAIPSTVNKTVLLDLINKVRKSGCQCGDTYYPPVPAVSWNEQLETAAYNHANDMHQNKYFSHTSPDGSNAGVRIERTGYYWMTYGENLASGYKNEQEVVAGWLTSPGHCKNIMNKAYREMGVARVANIWTQEFAVKK